MLNPPEESQPALHEIEDKQLLLAYLCHAAVAASSKELQVSY